LPLFLIVSLPMMEDIQKILDTIKREFGCDLNEISNLERMTIDLVNKISTIPDDSHVTLVCGTTGVGKSTMLSFLYDESSLIVDNTVNDEEVEVCEGEVNPDEEIEEVDESIVNDRKLTPEQLKAFKEKGWIVLDTETFRVGHGMGSVTLLPNFEKILTRDGGSIICFDLAGFNDNRGFIYKVIVDAMLSLILEKFVFRSLICLCSAEWFKQRTNAQAVADLRETIESIGLQKVLQMVIVRHEIPAEETVVKKVKIKGQLKQKSVKIPLTYEYYLKQCRLNTQPDIAPKSMTPRFIEAYDFFRPYIEKALFLSYKHFAKETRNELLLDSSSIKPQRPTCTYSNNPSTIKDMKSFFESLISLLVSKSAAQINVINNLVSDADSACTLLKKEIETIEENLKKLRSGTYLISDTKAHFDGVKANIESKQNTLVKEQEKLKLLESSKESHVKEGEDIVELGSERRSIKYNYTFSVSCYYDTANVSTYNNDSFSREDLSKSDTRSEIKINNNNWIENADIEVTFKGKRKYLKSWKNTLQEKDNNVTSQTSTVNSCSNILKDWQENLIHQQKLLAELYSSIPKTITICENQLLVTQKKLTAKEKEREEEQKRFVDVKNQYFDLVFDHLRRIKKSSLYEKPMTAYHVNTYTEFCNQFAKLSHHYGLI